MGDGMDQSVARRRAKELKYGIAVSARKGTTGKWITGGWPSDKDVWIVISLDRQTVLDDGDGPPSFETIMPVVAIDEAASMILAEKYTAAVASGQGGFTTARRMDGKVAVSHKTLNSGQASNDELAAIRHHMLAHYAGALRQEGWYVTTGDPQDTYPYLLAQPPETP